MFVAQIAGAIMGELAAQTHEAYFHHFMHRSAPKPTSQPALMFPVQQAAVLLPGPQSTARCMHCSA